MKVRRRKSLCLNCQHVLGREDNYCPECGQENNDQNVSFRTVINDFFGNYFSLDSRFGRSIKPFFIRPGYLTISYSDGRRVEFAHPVRLYLVSSLIYFLILSKAISLFVENGEIDFGSSDYNRSISSNFEEEQLDSLFQFIQSDSLPVEFFKKISTPGDINHLLYRLQDADNKILSDSLFWENQARFQRLAQLAKADSAWSKQFVSDTDGSDVVDKYKAKIDWDLLSALIANEDVLPEVAADSAKLQELNWFEFYVTRQAVRVERADDQGLAGFIIDNLPIMMITMLPVFALLLKLLYIRKRKVHLFIHHLIHSLHLHSFAFIFYGISLVITTNVDGTPALLIGIMSFMIVSTYAFLSLKRVYCQRWSKTLLKFSLLGVSYFFLLITNSVFVILLSLLFY